MAGRGIRALPRAGGIGAALVLAFGATPTWVTPAHCAVPATGDPPDVGEQAALPLSLADAVSLAEKRSSRIDRAARGAKIAELQVRNAKAGYYPRIDVSVTANQSARGSAFRSGDVAFDQRFVGNFRGGASVAANVPIDIAGTIRRRVKQARTSAQMSRLELERSRREVRAEVQIAYLTALRSQEAAATDQAVVGSIEALLQRAKAKASGVAPFLGVELAAARQQLSLSRTGAENSQDTLKQALGLSLELPLKLTSDLEPPGADADPEAAGGEAGDRLELEIAERRVDQADLAVVQSRDSRRPSITAGLYLDQYLGGHFVDDTGKTSTRSFGLNLSLRLPLLNFDAGQSGNNRRIARLQAEQARADLQDLRRQADLRLRQAKSAYERALERLDELPDPKLAAEALSRAEQALLAAPEGAAASLLAQVSNARSAWRSAEVAANDAYADVAIAAIRLQLARGMPMSASAGADGS